MICAFFWKILFTLAPWVRQRRIGFEYAKDIGKSGKPVFILSNHVNYLDVPLYISTLPMFSIVRKSRCFYNTHLDKKLPLFKYVSRGCHNIPVFFGKPPPKP